MVLWLLDPCHVLIGDTYLFLSLLTCKIRAMVTYLIWFQEEYTELIEQYLVHHNKEMFVIVMIGNLHIQPAQSP